MRIKKESWEVSRISMSTVMEVVEGAVTWSEEKPMRELVEDIVMEGWRDIEASRIMRMITNSENEIQEKRADEESLLSTLVLEEE